MNKILYGLIVTACSGLFCYQAYLNIALYFKHPTSKTNSQKFLGDVQFPLIEICLEIGYDGEVLRTHGYDSLSAMVRGESNDSFIGWAGNKNLTTDVMLDKSYSWKNLSQIIKRIRVNENDAHLKEVKMQYPEGKCFSVVGNGVRQRPNQNLIVTIDFKDVDTKVVKVLVTDPHRKTWKRDIFTYSGSIVKKDIGPKKGSERTFDIYNIQVSQSEDLEEDEEAHCQAYTTHPGETYADCVEAGLQRDYVKILGCGAPWFGPSGKNAICQERFGGNISLADHDVIDDMDISSVEVHNLQCDQVQCYVCRHVPFPAQKWISRVNSSENCPAPRTRGSSWCFFPRYLSS